MTHPYKFGDSQGWVGISHCAVWNDGQDNWYYASQGRFPTTAGGNAPNAVMLGHVRSYEYGKQKTAVSLVLGADHVISGALFRGSTWRYDASTRTLTLGTSTKMYVQRELDWEASPRRATIVYAGFSATGTSTYWGKKKP